MSRRVLLSALSTGALSVAPALWLWRVWPRVPAVVGTHFGAGGVPDHFAGRSWLWEVVWLPVVAFVVLTFLPQVQNGQSFFWSSPRQRWWRAGVVLVLALLVADIVRRALALA